MIASVVARIDPAVAEDPVLKNRLLTTIVNEDGIEIGELTGNHSLPLTLDRADKNDLHNLTRWLQSLEGIAFVDVVFVYFEDEESEQNSLS